MTVLNEKKRFFEALLPINSTDIDYALKKANSLNMSYSKLADIVKDHMTKYNIMHDRNDLVVSPLLYRYIFNQAAKTFKKTLKYNLMDDDYYITGKCNTVTYNFNQISIRDIFQALLKANSEQLKVLRSDKFVVEFLNDIKVNIYSDLL